MRVDDAIRELEAGNVRFSRLASVCESFFGKPRTRGSHRFFKVPWQGMPLVNIQAGAGGQAKGYQVQQVIEALRKLSATR